MRQKYFLYAEDDDDDIDIFTDVFERSNIGAVIEIVPDGYELLKYLQHVAVNEAFPCLIILDKKMPRLNGIETLELLKTDDLYRLIPVMIFSSGLTQRESDHCQSLGADIMIKPNEYVNWNVVVTKMCGYMKDEQ